MESVGGREEAASLEDSDGEVGRGANFTGGRGGREVVIVGVVMLFGSEEQKDMFVDLGNEGCVEGGGSGIVMTSLYPPKGASHHDMLCSMRPSDDILLVH